MSNEILKAEYGFDKSTQWISLVVQMYSSDQEIRFSSILNRNVHCRLSRHDYDVKSTEFQVLWSLWRMQTQHDEFFFLLLNLISVSKNSIHWNKRYTMTVGYFVRKDLYINKGEDFKSLWACYCYLRCMNSGYFLNC